MKASTRKSCPRQVSAAEIHRDADHLPGATSRTGTQDTEGATGKVLMLCYEYPPLGGGGARVVAGLIEQLRRLGQRVDLVTMGTPGQERKARRQDLAIDRIPCFRSDPSVCHPHEMILYVLLAFPHLVRKCRRNRYVVNHTHFIFPDGILAWLLHKITRLPYVITAHGSDVPGYNPDRFRFLHVILRPFWRSVTSNAALIICPSRHLQSLLLKANPVARTVVLPNGIDVDRFRPSASRRDSILVVTRMVKRKGVQYLIEALEHWNDHPEVNIVGDGPYLGHLKSLADKKNVKINFLGFIDNQSDRFKELLESSKYFVFTSSAENFPVVLLEAMSAGLAIVTTNDTGCVEVVGDTALLVPPENPAEIRKALRALINDEGLARSLMSRSRARVIQQFSALSIAESHKRIYEDCGVVTENDT